MAVADFNLNSSYTWLNSKTVIVCTYDTTRIGLSPQSAPTYTLYNLADGAKKRLGNLEATIAKLFVSDQSYAHPNIFSPDGKWLIYTIEYKTKQTATLENKSWLVALDGSKVLPLNFSTPNTTFFWNTDGSEFLIAEPHLGASSKGVKPYTLKMYNVNSGRYSGKTTKALDIDKIVDIRFDLGKQISVVETIPESNSLEFRKLSFRNVADEVETTSLRQANNALPEMREWKYKTDKDLHFAPVKSDLSPDGKYFLIGYEKYDANDFRIQDLFGTLYPRSTVSLYLVKTDGSGWKQIGSVGIRDYIDTKSFKWLPDSKRFSFLKDGKLWIANID